MTGTTVVAHNSGEGGKFGLSPIIETGLSFLADDDEPVTNNSELDSLEV